jgi:hypothetical protein
MIWERTFNIKQSVSSAIACSLQIEAVATVPRYHTSSIINVDSPLGYTETNEPPCLTICERASSCTEGMDRIGCGYG